MYLSARLIPDGTRTPMKKTLFPKIKEGDLKHSSKLLCLAAKTIPVTCTELRVENNGPVELLFAVVRFCHEHEITLIVSLPEYKDDNTCRPEDNERELLRFDTCPTCGARFSSSFHYLCPHCGGWGYAPYYEKQEELYKKCILNEGEECVNND